MSTNNLFPYEKELKDFVNSIDESNIEFNTGIPSWNKGITLSKEHRLAVSNSLKGQVPWNKGLTNVQVYEPKSAETRKKMSEAATKRWNKSSEKIL